MGMKTAEEQDLTIERLCIYYHHNYMLAPEVVRMPTEDEEQVAANFLPCKISMGFFMPSELCRH